MDDLISRQDALALVFDNVHDPTKAYRGIMELPSVKPQVRICQHCNEYDTNHHYCNLHEIEMSLTDFCSYAERMEVTE